MKYLVLIFTPFFFFGNVTAHSQEEVEHFYFHVNIADTEAFIVKEKRDGTFTIKNKNDKNETAIYEKYNIFQFKIAFPNTDRKLLKTVHTIETDNVELLSRLKNKFPNKYTRIDQFYPAKNPYYPNDYGTTSAVENKGNKYPSYDLDLIQAADAWSITRGNKKVIVGISDSKVDSLDPDLKGRVSNYLSYNNSKKGISCSHGTNIAGTAIGRMDNAYGRPGICSGCDVIAHSYGTMEKIEELVAAGAKVINTSWAMCKMGGNYSQNINERIKEYYDDGIIIVAGAGNGRDCNRDGIKIGDSLYPASYDRVISVTGTYLGNTFETDEVFPDKEGRLMTKRMNDRRNGYFYIEEDGTLTPNDPEKGMQVNKAIDLLAPAEGYLLGADICGKENPYGGASSNAAPYVTGTIGLMWSVNYCLTAYEVETILKQTSDAIEHLNGNEIFVGMLGAGRLNTYRAVEMANELKNPFGNVTFKNRDFYRFEFTISSAPNTITLQNQTFRDDATVDFKAKESIVLKSGTRIAPNKRGFAKLSIDPTIEIKECEPTPPKKYGSYKDLSTNNKPQ
ncbi:hypothetical protein ULMS_28310 [Patiriisocius marinistellae]|uniref:Peptidase S8/S53 domain-containing protein n=1 Tax=Patiriisocius marinistellae TaxID=2494560 RepID=A0A5J4FZ03_9FLAO|nr:S8 family serine peptidase [Patiriisocius marinistellae]GEQ87323.1 hypothetical protein ULMS_28310 [Patiriisocius marinistellae]